MRSRRFLPLLLVLFVGSGCAALIYEIVWFQLLQLVIGSTAVSMGVLLGTFMGGMGIGSLALPRYVPARRHPLLVYGALELGIGAVGMLVLFALPYAGGAYTAVAGQGAWGVVTRAVLCAVCLLPPTVLMGASLPAIARWIETTPAGVSWLGFFYGGNTAGAVVGSLAAGFYLLRVHDMPTATYVAAGLNLAVAALAIGLSRLTAHAPGPAAGAAPAPVATFARRAWPVYVAIALSGLAALGAEVVWTRLLSLLLGGTTYTFSIILAVFLIGIGLGSSAGAAMVRGRLSARLALGACQLLLVACVAWAAYLIARALPYWPIDPGLSPSPRFTLEIDFARVLFTVLPAALLWGASFPLALAAVAEPGQDPGRLVGGVYAANTVGAILGALLFSIFLIPMLGTRDAERALMLVAAVAAALLLAPWAVPRSARRARAGALGAAALAAGLLVWATPDIPFELIAYGRQMPWRLNEVTELYRGEGRNASIGVSQEPNGVRNFHVSGKVEASSEPQDMRLQRMLGSLPALFQPDARSVLVVGFGAGVTAGSVLPFPTVTSERICEIEPLIPPNIGPYFAEQNFNVLHDPRVAITYDDARHFILTTDATYDIITSDPIHPWVKGAATLYTEQYFELVKRHLNPGRPRHAMGAPVREQRSGREERDRDLLPRVPQRHHLGQHRPGPGLRSRPAGPGGAAAPERRLPAGAPPPARHAVRGGVAGRRGVLHSGRPAGDVRRPRLGPRPVDRRRADQSRSEPAAAVPGRHDPGLVQGRSDLQGASSGTAASRTDLITGSPATLAPLRAAFMTYPGQ